MQVVKHTDDPNQKVIMIFKFYTCFIFIVSPLKIVLQVILPCQVSNPEG